MAIDLPFGIYYNERKSETGERYEPRDDVQLYRPPAGEAALAWG